MGRKTKYREGFDKGYENGILSVIAYIDYFINYKLKSKKAKEQCNKFLKENFEKYIPRFGKTEPTLYEKTFCYYKTYNYRGIDVDIFADDYGQQDYFYYKNQSYSGGAYNPNIEEYVRYIIDEDLDTVHSFIDDDEIYAGAFLRYADHEHTELNLTYMLKVVYTFTKEKILELQTMENVIEFSKKVLDDLFSIDKETEELRKSSEDLNFNNCN